MVTGMALFAQAPPIYGGTDQVQKNIIGERVLGLPKEANNDKTAPSRTSPRTPELAGRLLGDRPELRRLLERWRVHVQPLRS